MRKGKPGVTETIAPRFRRIPVSGAVVSRPVEHGITIEDGMLIGEFSCILLADDFSQVVPLNEIS